MLLVMLLSCSKEQIDLAERIPAGLTDGFCLVIGDSLLITHEEISHYDLSTHMVYFKEEQEFLRDRINLDMAYNTFRVFAGRDSIYGGPFYPMWSSSIFPGPCIHWPSFYPPYALSIQLGYPWPNGPAENGDPRSDSRILTALEQFDQLRQGLMCTIDEIQVLQGGGVEFSFTVNNLDEENYYVLSPEKMGHGLYHYFTNGLYLWSEATSYLENGMVHEAPQEGWDISWMDLLEGGTSLSYTLTYSNFEAIPPGTYDASFRLPGLSWVDQGKLHRAGGSIWLGYVYAQSAVTIN